MNARLARVLVVVGLAGCGDNYRVADTAAPNTVILTGPDAVVMAISASFTFAASPADPGTTFECSLDGVDFAECNSPLTTAALVDGGHAFHVRAVDAAGNADPTPAMHAWTVDTAPPAITITGGPEGTTTNPTPTFTFSIAGAYTASRCRVDTAAFAPCTDTFTPPPLAEGPHVFEVEAGDAAGNTGSATRSFDVAIIIAVCGNGIAEPGEVCDGGDLAGATCESAGHAPGTLACAATCDGYAIAGCDGGFIPANTGFVGKVCIDGVKFNRPGGGNFLAACAEDTGVFRATTTATTVSWTNINGTTAPSLEGRAVLTSYDNPTVLYLTDNTDGVIEPNGFRSNNFDAGAPSWMAPPVSFAADSMPIEVFTAHPGTSTNNHVGGWHPVRGAVVVHGSFNASATVSTVGPGVTGTVTGISIPVFTGTTTDVTIAVFGRTPAGDAAVGGIYWSCDQIGTAGGNYVPYDTGIAAADKPLVYSITADTFSLDTMTPRLCQSTGTNVFGFAAIKYAAVRGGNRVYKTTNGGATWSPSANGIPGGAEVYAIAIDCIGTLIGSQCNNHDLLFAATSVGLYKSMDAGGTWTLAGLEGKRVRSVALQPDHPLGTAPRILVGVDDAIGIYQRLP